MRWNIFLKKKQTKAKFDLFNKLGNNFLAILELCAFYIEYEKVKFTAINFRGLSNVKYFMQTQFLRFCKDIAKVNTHKLNFSIKNLSSKCVHICIKLRIYSHLLNKILNGKLHVFVSWILLVLILSLASFSTSLIATLLYTLHQSTPDTD